VRAPSAAKPRGSSGRGRRFTAETDSLLEGGVSCEPVSENRKSARSSGFDVFLILSICPPKKAEEAELEPSSGFDVFHFSRCSAISNSEHVRILPPSWGTLFQLTRLPVVPKLLDQAVEF
jgi:hypothetical protein